MRLALYTAPIIISFHSFSTESCQRAIVGGKTSIVIRAIQQGCIALLLKSATRSDCTFYYKFAVGKLKLRTAVEGLKEITFIFTAEVT